MIQVTGGVSGECQVVVEGAEITEGKENVKNSLDVWIGVQGNAESKVTLVKANPGNPQTPDLRK